MSEYFIEFNAKYNDIEISKKVVKGFRLIEKDKIEDAEAYFKSTFNIDIDGLVNKWENIYSQRTKTTIRGGFDISITDIPDPDSLGEVLSFTGAKTIKIVVFDSQTGEEQVVKIDNSKLTNIGSSVEPFHDLDLVALQKIIFKAISQKDIEMLNNVYSSGIDVNMRFKNGETALMRASSYKRVSDKSIDVIMMLIGFGADLHICDDDGDMALMHAASAGSLKVVQALVEAGADPSKRGVTSGHSRETTWNAAEWNLLHFAFTSVGEGYIEKEIKLSKIIEYLIKNGASIDKVIIKYPEEIYQTIASNDLLQTAKILFEHDENFLKHAKHSLNYASKRGHTETTEFIKKKTEKATAVQCQSCNAKKLRLTHQDSDNFICKQCIAKQESKANLQKQEKRKSKHQLPEAFLGEEWQEPHTNLKFVWVPGGTFNMGDTFDDDEGLKEQSLIHKVCVDGFYMSRYLVTQGEYEQVMKANPSYFKNGSRYPVERVRWEEVQGFISKLNKLSGKNFRLPTEAEWEYAARERGKKIRFGTGKNTIGSDEANFDASDKNFKMSYSRIGQFRGQTTEVGTFLPNDLGLYDMTGNVNEWCADWHGEDYYSDSSRNNPQGPISGKNRVIRGGGWSDLPFTIHVGFRSQCNPDKGRFDLGFRLVLSVC